MGWQGRSKWRTWSGGAEYRFPNLFLSSAPLDQPSQSHQLYLSSRLLLYTLTSHLPLSYCFLTLLLDLSFVFRSSTAFPSDRYSISNPLRLTLYQSSFLSPGLLCINLNNEWETRKSSRAKLQVHKVSLLPSSPLVQSPTRQSGSCFDMSSFSFRFGSTGLSAVQICQVSLGLYLSLSFSSLSHFCRSNLSVSASPHSSTLNMSTSTSTASPSALGECVVCGKESSTRCSSCGKGGVNWMFFCSREHQKIVSNAIFVSIKIDFANNFETSWLLSR